MVYQDISLVCRICLTENDKNESMYESTKGLSYKDMIKEFIGMDMIESDNLPCSICEMCSSELRIVVSFVTKCKSSLKKLQSTLSGNFLIQGTIIVKEEEDLPLSVLCSKKEEAATEDIKTDELLMPSQIKEENVDDDHYYDTLSDYGNDITETLQKQKVKCKEKKVKKIKRNPFECKICWEACESEKLLKKHRESHKGEKPFMCTHCGRSFRLKCTLREHIARIHMKSIHLAKKSCICDLCGKVCFRRNDLTLHLRTHTNEKPYKCSLCGDRFTQNSSLRLHLRRHSGEKPFSCHICGKGFVATSGLKTHMSVHSSDRNYVCQVCNKGVKTSKALKQHLLLHSSHKPNVCEMCGAAFAQKVNLKTHIIAKHSVNAGTCEICKKTFSNLPEHNRVHTGEKPFTCNICGRGFPRQRNLTTHLRRHREATKFRCTQDKCDAAFPMQCQLDFHVLKFHTKYFPYKCGCNKGFYRLADMSKHINASNCKKGKEST